MGAVRKSFRTAIADYENLSDVSQVYTAKEVACRFHVSRSTIVRWSDIDVFPAKFFVYNGVRYRYYTEDQCIAFEASDFYKNLPSGSKKIYAKISTTVHDFEIEGESVVFTSAEIAEKLGISLQSVHRMDRAKSFEAKRVRHNNRTYRYYSLEQYEMFVSSPLYSQLRHIRYSDIIGSEIGKLKILSFSASAVRKGYYGSYVCECACGNIVELPRSELLSGKAKSCGCKFHDLTGLTFGWWHVDSLADFAVMNSGQRVFRYNCSCICGKRNIVFAGSLRSGRSQSCGCVTQPIGEVYITTYLNSLGLFPLVDDVSDGYIQHKRYDDLLGVGGNCLSYDFYIRWNNCEWLIEYQGQQHYRPVDYFGGDSKFDIQLEHDARKRAYAQKLGILLIEISYEYLTYEAIANFLKNHEIC